MAAENDLMDKAINRLYSYCEENGCVFMQPSISWSRIDRNFVYLNDSGESLMYRYNIQEDKLIFKDGTIY